MTNEQKYIAYYRVSTKKQGETGYGLDAQKSEVIRTVSNNGIIINEYTDIESGKNNNRVNLEAALKECKETGAMLIIAKLDRLSRDVAFIFELKNSGVTFKACDLPDFNTLTLGIFATMAQYEREIISKRTKAGLQAAKERGVELGRPNAVEHMKEINHLGREINLANLATSKRTRDAKNVIVGMRKDGLSFRAIAHKLNTEKDFEDVQPVRNGTIRILKDEKGKPLKDAEGNKITEIRKILFSDVQVKRIFERATK